MINVDLIIIILKNQYNEYSSKIKPFISQQSTTETNQISKKPFNRTCVKLILLCLLISTIYLLLIRTTTVAPPAKTFTIQIQKNTTEKPKRTKLNAFIITANCSSPRFNATRENIEGAFPNFFNILCFLNIPLSDPRIHTADAPVWKKFSSNQLAFIELWSYVIPECSKDDPYEWSFIFEDDVNFNNATTISLPDYITPLKEMMNNREIQIKDGFMYLGICGPDYSTHSPILISKNSNESLTSQKAYGYCLHATGITAKRAELFWTEISSYRPNSGEHSLDFQIREYSMRSRKYFYVFGTNFHWPPDTGHFGIAFQDRGRFVTTVA